MSGRIHRRNDSESIVWSSMTFRHRRHQPPPIYILVKTAFRKTASAGPGHLSYDGRSAGVNSRPVRQQVAYVPWTPLRVSLCRRVERSKTGIIVNPNSAIPGDAVVRWGSRLDVKACKSVPQVCAERFSNEASVVG